MAKNNTAQKGFFKSCFDAIKGGTRSSLEGALETAERGSQRALLEQLFYDFNRSRSRVYWMNFFRGIFFGVGSVIGGTLVVAILVSILSFFADLPGVLGQLVQYIVDIVNRSPNL